MDPFSQWTCLALGGRLHGEWITTHKWRAVQTADSFPGLVAWDTLATIDVMELPPITTYVPRRFVMPGWAFPLVFYVHQSLGIVEPEIPLGTVLPGGLMGMAGESEKPCLVCYGEPVPGYPFCSGSTAGVLHSRVVAELSLMMVRL